jgi:hypothetical protein
VSTEALGAGLQPAGTSIGAPASGSSVVIGGGILLFS